MGCGQLDIRKRLAACARGMQWTELVGSCCHDVCLLLSDPIARDNESREIAQSEQTPQDMQYDSSTKR